MLGKKIAHFVILSLPVLLLTGCPKKSNNKNYYTPVRSFSTHTCHVYYGDQEFKGKSDNEGEARSIAWIRCRSQYPKGSCIYKEPACD